MLDLLLDSRRRTGVDSAPSRGAVSQEKEDGEHRANRQRQSRAPNPSCKRTKPGEEPPAIRDTLREPLIEVGRDDVRLPVIQCRPYRALLCGKAAAPRAQLQVPLKSDRRVRIERLRGVSDDELFGDTIVKCACFGRAGHRFFPLYAMCASRSLSDPYARNNSDFTADSEHISTPAISE